MKIAPELIPINFLPARVDVERRAGGVFILRSPETLRPYVRCLGEYLERWSTEKPNDVFLAQRDGENWRKITWAETRRMVHAIATSLLERGSRRRPSPARNHGALACRAGCRHRRPRPRLCEFSDLPKSGGVPQPMSRSWRSADSRADRRPARARARAGSHGIAP